MSWDLSFFINLMMLEKGEVGWLVTNWQVCRSQTKQLVWTTLAQSHSSFLPKAGQANFLFHVCHQLDEKLLPPKISLSASKELLMPSRNFLIRHSKLKKYCQGRPQRLGGRIGGHRRQRQKRRRRRRKWSWQCQWHDGSVCNQSKPCDQCGCLFVFNQPRHLCRSRARVGADLGVNKKGTPLYSREDIREQYCINEKELQVLDKSQRKNFLGCFSNSGQVRMESGRRREKESSCFFFLIFYTWVHTQPDFSIMNSKL